MRSGSDEFLKQEDEREQHRAAHQAAAAKRAVPRRAAAARAAAGRFRPSPAALACALRGAGFRLRLLARAQLGDRHLVAFGVDLEHADVVAKVLVAAAALLASRHLSFQVSAGTRLLRRG